MIRILQVVNIMDRAGIENMLMNYYRNIDREKIQFDFLTHRPKRGVYDDEIEELGGEVFYAPRLYPWNYIEYFAYMKQFFAKHKEYSIIHSHIDAMSYMPLLAAKKAGVKTRIAHSHCTGMDLDYKIPMKLFFKSQINKVANVFCACTIDAGKYLFGNKDIHIIPNAIDERRFVYNEGIREKVRKKLGIEDNFVIGHVGRFTYQKNHEFIIRVFDQLQKDYSEVKLLLVGDGIKKENIKKQINKVGLSKKVIILDSMNNIEDYYQAMDVFILPSRFEGLGICAVEAQVTGLKTILSEYVPREASISSETVFLPLDVSVWVAELLKSIEVRTKRTTQYSEFYDIRYAVKNLEAFYIERGGCIEK